VQCLNSKFSVPLSVSLHVRCVLLAGTPSSPAGTHSVRVLSLWRLPRLLPVVSGRTHRLARDLPIRPAGVVLQDIEVIDSIEVIRHP